MSSPEWTTVLPKRKVISPINDPRSSPASAALDENGLDQDGFKKVLTKKEKGKLRKVERHKPKFLFDQNGLRNGRKVGIAHIRDLVLYITADAQKPNWIFAQNHSYIQHTVILLVPGLLPEHLGIPPSTALSSLPFPLVNPAYTEQGLPPSKVPMMDTIFMYGIPTRAPGDQRRLFSVFNTLLNSPLPDHLRKQREKESRKRVEMAKVDGRTSLLYLMTPGQMADNDYPLPSYTNGSRVNDDQDGWVETPQAMSPPSDGRYPVLAVDCEMVVAGKEQVLARVSIVDVETDSVIFDELVKPPCPVTDYRTQWSGITSAQLESATHTLSTIQEALISSDSPIITPHTILLGHSLECDLTALRLRHALCIDTALIFTHPRGAPYKPGLKWLTQKWLDREIQGGTKGHDSVEDAKACVDLLKLKMANGPDFGSFMDTTESIFERIGRYRRHTEETPPTTAVCDNNVGPRHPGNKATTAVSCIGDDDVVKAIGEQVKTHDFVFGRLLELSHVQGWNRDTSSEIPPSETVDEDSALSEALENFNNRLNTLHSSLPPDTAFILMTGHSNPLPMLQLSEKRQKWERLVKSLGNIDDVPKDERWMLEDDRELESAVSQAREGMAFFCVK
ncbi:hypothetical protein M231_00471 [Tremella mesenterica]|uniref:Exonuclease domain-containing protein n=1 Tax=Tremella mesenterica TaxID=5217 RepID=A0A4Q1BVF9_TREME|nr:hypothetical protein M231_00471 [Tremella mesenterica]